MSEDRYKPFHESIVMAVITAKVAELKCLGELILATKIPQNHDRIIEVWEEKIAFDPLMFPGGVVTSLLGQKKKAEALERSSTNSVS